MSFQQWMSDINDHCLLEFGMSIFDLPDLPFYDSYESGLTPRAFMEEQIPDLEALGGLILG